MKIDEDAVSRAIEGYAALNDEERVIFRITMIHVVPYEPKRPGRPKGSRSRKLVQEKPLPTVAEMTGAWKE